MRALKAWHGVGVSLVLLASLGAACSGVDSTQLLPGAVGSGGAAGVDLGAGSGGAAGSSAGAAGSAPAAGDPNGPQDDLDLLTWSPSFEPDYNTLQPQPWVQPLTRAQADDVDVTPATLQFKSAAHAEVLSWEPGRVVVSAPSEGAGKNPLGFARRVVSVASDGTNITVNTVSLGLEDIVTGDIQMVIDQSAVKSVDLGKLDLAWASAHLYQDLDILELPEPEPLRDDEPTLYELEDADPLPGADPGLKKLFKKAAKAVKKAVTKAAKKVEETAVKVWEKVTPETVEGSTNFNPQFDFDQSEGLFALNGGFEQTFNTGKYPITLFMDGSAQVASTLRFNPGVQVGAKVPFPGHSAKPVAWLNFDSRVQTGLKLTLDLEAGLRSADNSAGAQLGERLAQDADFASEVLGEAKQQLLGSPDMKPAGGWKRTLFISKPAYQVVLADVVPVVFVETFQLDLECGFEAKASAQAVIELRQASTFKFGVRAENGKASLTQKPSFQISKQQELEVTGGGEVSVSCGLIPRVNAFIYDTIGIFAGVRHSLVARAAFRSTCEPDPLETAPKGAVDLGLKGNVGVQVGARVQAPGSSFAGTAGTIAGIDLGGEPWQYEYNIYSKTFSVGKGLGYCTPGCRDADRNFSETGVDCGGGQCPSCELGQGCSRNSDCRVGYCSGGVCSTNSCGDGVEDGNETDVDCGGSCSRCGAGSSCSSGYDCQSGFCNRQYAAEGACIDDHCQDGAQDADECGIDCGGEQCAKCANFARCAEAEECQSGITDGQFCVASDCNNRERDGGESGVDCGGDTSCRRCGAGEGCSSDGDCSASAQSCVLADGAERGTCEDLCHNGVKDANEADVDCSHSCPERCGAGQACRDQSDCSEGLLCNNDVNRCVAPL
ncbi:MAG TPA: hypothetical protein VFS67_02025 [Polyangiaceae bacterium]|jgi:hypothetical protein|nr:hypothetical protein [Polyangiaceae bacterium]